MDLRNADLSKVSDYRSMFNNNPSNIKIYLKDTEANRNFMNTNFNNINTSYIS